MQAYILDLISLDIDIERGGKEKRKKKENKKYIEMNSKAWANKNIITYEAVQLIFCNDDYAGQHSIKYIYIYIYIYIF